MTIQELQSSMPEYAKDIKLNLSSVLDDQSGLNESQVLGIALASSYAVKNKEVETALLLRFDEVSTDEVINAAKAAASIMAMNNIYYRFIHLVSDKEYAQMPAKLRMNIMAKSGVAKEDFELNALAVSAINGCGMCIDSHEKVLREAGLSKQAIQHAIRIASVIHAADQVLVLEREAVEALA